MPTTLDAASPPRLVKQEQAAAPAVAAANAEVKAQPPPAVIGNNRDDNDDDDDDGDKLFHGIRFYLAYDIDPKRRAELRTLIKNNGGEALPQFKAGAVELVESERLTRGKDWVSVDFVYDSVRDRVLRDLTQYMSSVPTPATSSSSKSSKVPAKVDARRLGRMPYTVQEDAAMLQYVLDDPLSAMKPMKPLPLSVWKRAASLKITNRTDQSMHQRYRDTLMKLTPQERANTLKNARDEAEAQQRRHLAAQNGKQATTVPAPTISTAKATATVMPPKDQQQQQPVTTSSAPANVKKQVVASPPAAAIAPPTADAASTKPTISLPAALEPASAPPSAAKSSPPTSKSPRETPTAAAPVKTPITSANAKAEPSATPLAAAVPSETKTAQDTVAPAAPSVKRQRANSLLSSRWAAIIDDTSRRSELQQFFHAPEPPAATATASVEGETRRRKRTASSSTRKHTTGKSRANGKETAAAAPTPRKQRKLRQQQSAGASAAEQTPVPPPAALTTTRPPPPPAPVIEDVTSESAIQALICQIQFATNQDVNAIVHALFYASGDVGVATAFLEGENPRDVWSHHDDVVLEPLVCAATDEHAVEDAFARGAFARMRVERSPAQIWTRIRYLL